MGKLMVEGDFGPYYGLVSPTRGDDLGAGQPDQTLVAERM
jgi:hypothetical protein